MPPNHIPWPTAFQCPYSGEFRLRCQVRSGKIFRRNLQDLILESLRSCKSQGIAAAYGRIEHQSDIAGLNGIGKFGTAGVSEIDDEASQRRISGIAGDIQLNLPARDADDEPA